MSSDVPSGHILAMTDKVKAAFKVNFDLYLDFGLEVVQTFFPSSFLSSSVIIDEVSV